MRKLITLAAAGMLLVAMLPATASAVDPCTGRYATDGVSETCQTTATFDVTDGTTIWAPAAMNLGQGFPGQTIDSAWDVDYATNVADQVLNIASTNLTWVDAVPDPDTTWTINADNIFLGAYTLADPINGAGQVIAALNPSTGNDSDFIHFHLNLRVPSVANATGAEVYSGTVTFTTPAL